MSCTTQREAVKVREASHREVNAFRGDTSSVVEHTVVFDTIHVVRNETIWREPDSVGRQYPLKTIRMESDGGRVAMSERVEQRRDTVYVSVDETRLSSGESKTRESEGYGWVPWVIVVGMVVVAAGIIVIKGI